MDERLAAAERAINKVTYKPNSTNDRGISQAYFECFVLENHSTDPYAEFLGRLLSKMNSSIPNSSHKETMIEPTETLLISWVYHLRDDATDTLHATDAGADSTDAAALHTSASATPLAGRSLKWATILKHKRQISGTLIELRGAKSSHCPRLETLITSFEEDGESKAPAFLPDEVFEDLWDALWGGLPIGYTKKVAAVSSSQMGALADNNAARAATPALTSFYKLAVIAAGSSSWFNTRMV
jgi:hypothetical protein